jgi:hypothetical protein
MLEITWRELYRTAIVAAIVERDPVVQEIRVRAAANAIKARASEAGVVRHERKELGDALDTLGRLKPCVTA